MIIWAIIPAPAPARPFATALDMPPPLSAPPYLVFSRWNYITLPCFFYIKKEYCVLFILFYYYYYYHNWLSGFFFARSVPCKPVNHWLTKILLHSGPTSFPNSWWTSQGNCPIPFFPSRHTSLAVRYESVCFPCEIGGFARPITFVLYLRVRKQFSSSIYIIIIIFF